MKRQTNETALRAKLSSKNQASKLQIIGGSTTQQQTTQQENCLTNSRTLASNKQKQTRDGNIFSSENRNQPRYNENTMLTQTNCSRNTISVDTSNTEIQTRSSRNQSHSIHEIRENSMERYEFSSNIRQPTVHFNLLNNYLQFTRPNQQTNIFAICILHEIRKTRTKKSIWQRHNWIHTMETLWNGTSGIVISNQQYMIMCSFRMHRKSPISKTLSQIAQRKAFWTLI